MTMGNRNGEHTDEGLYEKYTATLLYTLVTDVQGGPRCTIACTKRVLPRTNAIEIHAIKTRQYVQLLPQI